MANISYDGQSLSIDGRRIWLVSGAIHSARTPRELWRSRIRAARQAGLNCIETYVFWNRHEPTPGRFDFEGDNDLRHFLQLVAAEGMYAWVRPGPYVCAEWDFGGLPAWLVKTDDIRLRESDGRFLEACSRYLSAVMEQIRDLQVTAPGDKPGPIVLMQAENEWFCHNPEQGESYLREIVRYLLENGCTVPITSCNNLWQRVDGTIDTWNAAKRLPTDLRQLRIVQPEAPRIVSEFWTGWFDHWGGGHDTEKEAETLLYRMAGVLAVGGQYNLYMFHGGTNFGFTGGRTVCSPDCFMITSYDYDAPLKEAGGRGDKYLAVKRISTFASQFASVLANLDQQDHHATLALDESDHGPIIISQHGSQGDAIFIFRSPGAKPGTLPVMLGNGLTLDVPMGTDRVAWLVVDANLGGVATLTYTNIRPWAFIGRKLLVLFGPAGAAGELAIDDTPASIQTPTGKTPTVQTVGDIHVLVLNDEQIDVAYLHEGGVVVGAASIDDDGQVVPAAGWATQYQVTVDGQINRMQKKPAKRKPVAPKLADWSTAPVDQLLSGEADAYADIDGPMSLEQLDCGFGYGWYRIRMPRAAKGAMLAPLCGDRLHVFREGKPVTVMGLGAGADNEPANLSLSGDVIVLADNMGRFNYGWRVGERKGLAHHLHKVRAIRLGQPKVETARAPDPFELRGFVQGVHAGQPPRAPRLTWKFKPTGKNPVILELSEFPQRAMILINDHPVDLYDPNLSAHTHRWLLDHGDERLKGGENRLTLALYDELEKKADAVRAVRLWASTGEATGKAGWAFARWAMPDDDDFQPAPSSKSAVAGLPCWHRVSFTTSQTRMPLWFDATGLSKGQLFLNGRNIGRYWVADPSGKAVTPQTLYYLPEPWLSTDSPNVLTVFDEHGFGVDACKLVYDPDGPFG